MPKLVPFPSDLNLVENIVAQLRFALSAATSYHWNRRNLESPWYGYWNQLLVLLLATIPSVVIVPQDELWPYRCGKKKEHWGRDVLDGLAEGDSQSSESSDSETEDEDVIDDEDDLDGAYEADDSNVDLDGGDDDRDDSRGNDNNDSGLKEIIPYEVSNITSC